MKKSYSRLVRAFAFAALIGLVSGGAFAQSSKSPSQFFNRTAKSSNSVYTTVGTMHIMGELVAGFGYQNNFGDLQLNSDDTVSAKASKKFLLQPINTDWQSNVAMLFFDYSNRESTHGVFMGINADTGAGTNWSLNVPYFFLWANVWDHQIQGTIGKPYSRCIPKSNDMVYMTQSNWQFSGAYPALSFVEPWEHEQIVARLEYSPDWLPWGYSLKAGIQYFLGNEDGSTWDPKDNEREYGIGLSWNCPWFSINAGFRDDGPDSEDLSNCSTTMQILRSGSASPLGAFYGMNRDIASRRGDLMSGAATSFPGGSAAAAAYLGTKQGGQSMRSGGYAMNLGGYTVIGGVPANDGQYVYFGAEMKNTVITNLNVQAQGWLVNLGDYNHFGFGHMDQSVGYDISEWVRGVSVSFSSAEDFFGKDVWAEGVPDPVYWRLCPKVGYSFKKFGIGTDVVFGLAKDVIEGTGLQWDVTGTYNLGGPSGQNALTIKYSLQRNKYTNYSDPIVTNTIGINVMMVF
jgi:hypothetical protein